MTGERSTSRRVSVTDAARMLSTLVDEVQAPGVTVEITRNGRVAAVLIEYDTLESLTKLTFATPPESPGTR